MPSFIAILARRRRRTLDGNRYRLQLYDHAERVPFLPSTRNLGCVRGTNCSARVGCICVDLHLLFFLLLLCACLLLVFRPGVSCGRFVWCVA